MANQQVPAIQTPVSETELTRAFYDTAKKLYGIELSKAQLAILVAHNNLETGNRRAMYNYNIGNIMHFPGQDNHDYYIHGDRMKDKDGNWVPFKARFRSYPTLTEATEDYIRNLHNRGGGVWQGMLSGDPAAFSKALKKTNYYGADEADTVDPKTGKVQPGYTSIMMAGVKGYNKRPTYEQAISSSSAQPVESDDLMSRINNLLSRFLSALAEDNNIHQNLVKQQYKQYLPEHKYLIRIDAIEMCDALEFARVLSSAMKEELLAEPTIFCQGSKIEMECKVHGNYLMCTEAVAQLCGAMSDTFELATYKLGGIKIATHIVPNTSSNYQELDIKLAEVGYQLFHHKIASINGN